MYLLYSLLLTLGLVILLPRFAVDALRAGKYVTGLRERLGRIPIQNDRDRPLIWLHCVSVGETEAAKPLVKALSERFPLHRLAVSTTTVTGQQVARRAFKDTATIFYFPLDLNWIVRRVLGTLRPSVVLIVETELWPNLLRECHRQSIPVALLNGRISENSFRRYLWIRSFMRRVLGNISVALMQSHADAERIRELGMPADRLLTHGNIKFDGAELSEADTSVAESFRDRFAFSSDQNIIVAASTHDPEETIVIEAFRRLIDSKHANSARLIVAPRHPERFEEIAKQLDAAGLKWSRRSAPASDADRFANMVLMDSLGELRAVYTLADVAFVGGSIAQRGGHNVLEPASQGICTVTGPHMNNFTSITSALLEEDAIVQMPEVPIEEAASVLASTLRDLLESPDRRQQIGARARAVCDRNRGATEKTVQTISQLLQNTEAARQPIPLPNLQATAK
jgi:3-deoxy-D-manno-octulosonic-acid transferase